jgi:eukaryotic-like serine/threonine-protein kinase
MPELGDILDEKYRLIGLVGAGGMGRVFEAEHLEIGKKVAIKFPRTDLGGDPKALARFRQEPRVAAATGHPGIVDIYDAGTDRDGLPYVVMEYLQGESLGALLAREKRLEIPVATSIIAQVLAAIDAAHSRTIVHRDLKPDNVFLVDTGHHVQSVKILDFGTSKVLGALTGCKEKLTESGAVLGTPFYMAPELVLDEPDLDHRLDIYAIGVMFYETLTGRLPFEATNVLSLAHKIVNEEVERPRVLRPDLPEGLEEIVLRALARDRRQRFRSAASMLQALLPYIDERALGQLALPASLRGLGGRPSEPADQPAPMDATQGTDSMGPGASVVRPTKRSRGQVVAAVIALVSVAVVLGLALHFWPERPTDVRTAPAAERPASIIITGDAGVGGDREARGERPDARHEVGDASPERPGDAVVLEPPRLVSPPVETHAAPKVRPGPRQRREEGAGPPPSPEPPQQPPLGAPLQFSNEWNPG